MRLKQLKEKRGITLIALIVTIIVLIILAVLAINLTIRQNGIIDKAKLAKQNYEDASDKEQSDLNELYSQIMVATNDDAIISNLKVSELKTLVKQLIQEEAETSSTEDTTPVGTVISYMGTIVPTNYLPCDGTEYQISQYPELAAQIETNFGSKNKFGGDGTTTFKVPDLRGEFLRGTGTNSHANQGSGSNVGTHQDATRLPDYSNSGTDINGACSRVVISPADSQGGSVNTSYYAKTGTYTSTNRLTWKTTRPTNTSVLYCIKCK